VRRKHRVGHAMVWNQFTARFLEVIEMGRHCIDVECGEDGSKPG